jgi:hypothetical protein
MKIIFLVVVFGFVQASSLCCYGKEPSREEREVEMAEYSILSALAADSFVKTRYRCTQNEQACIGASPAELGLALLASKTSSTSNKKLIQLIRFRLDGGLATDYACYVVGKGKSIESVLKAQMPDKLQADCLEDVKRLTARTGKLFEGFNPVSVCRSSLQIAAQKSELLAALQQKTKCDF